jgi:hypothetical protein
VIKIDRDGFTFNHDYIEKTDEIIDPVSRKWVKTTKLITFRREEDTIRALEYIKTLQAMVPEDRPEKVLDQLTLFFENDIRTCVRKFCMNHSRFKSMLYSDDAMEYMYESAEEIFKKSIMDKYDPYYREKEIDRLKEELIKYNAIKDQPNFNMNALYNTRSKLKKIYKATQVEFFERSMFKYRRCAIVLGLSDKYNQRGESEYKCHRCEHTFRELNTVKDLVCHTCGNDDLKLISGIGVPGNKRILTPYKDDRLKGHLGTKTFTDLGVYDKGYDPTNDTADEILGNIISDASRNLQRNSAGNTNREQTNDDIIKNIRKELTIIEAAVFEMMRKGKPVSYICHDLKLGQSTTYDIIKRINKKCAVKGRDYFKHNA